MAVDSRAARREGRRPRAVEMFGPEAEAALDVFELVEFSWHDCFGAVSPPEAVIDDIFVCSEGQMSGLAKAARMSVNDSRDLRVWADDLRSSP